MNEPTLQIKGITFLNTSNLKKRVLNQYDRLPYKSLFWTEYGLFYKMYAHKFQIQSARAAYVLVHELDREKYENFEGYLDM